MKVNGCWNCRFKEHCEQMVVIYNKRHRLSECERWSSRTLSQLKTDVKRTDRLLMKTVSESEKTSLSGYIANLKIKISQLEEDKEMKSVDLFGQFKVKKPAYKNFSKHLTQD